MQLKIAPTLLMLAALLVAAVAVPAMAQPGESGRPTDAGRPEDRGQQGRGNDTDRSHGADRGQGADRSNQTRGPPAHVIARLEARCEVVENETGRRPVACDRLERIHSDEHRARRAAHAGMGALAAWHHLNATLNKLEQMFEQRLAQENLTEDQTQAFAAKLDRIEAMQANLTAKIDAMEAKVDAMKERWQSVREHLGHKVHICHVDEDNSTRSLHVARAAWPAHARHGDTLGPCDDEGEGSDGSAESPEQDLGQEDAGSSNETADP